jgi:hypothetical protein
MVGRSRLYLNQCVRGISGGRKNMRITWSAIILIGSLSLTGVCQADQKNQLRNTEMVGQNSIEKCPVNPDPLYDRKGILERFTDVLNESAPGFKKYEDRGFYVKDEKPQQFFIFDLTDPSNKSAPSSGCINFLNKHIYDFAAIYIPFSLSHVAILEDGKLTLFKAINCENSKDSIDAVIMYVERKLHLNDNDEIIQRVRDYRKYGEYSTVDDLVIRCRQLTVLTKTHPHSPV